MKRRIHVLAVAFCAMAALFGLATWNAAFRVPSTSVSPLPEGLVAVESPAGQQLLAERLFIADYESLVKNFESQSRPAFCGVASSVIVLNSLRASESRLTQPSFFTESVSRIRNSLQVTFAGMTLAQLTDLLRAHGVEATLFYASDTSVEVFRSIMQTNLNTPGDYLLVNYQRAALGQAETGHISPLAAYNAASDRVLILDVAAYKYPPVWVSTDGLWKAMNTVDAASGHTRGFVIVRATRQGIQLERRKTWAEAAWRPRPIVGPQSDVRADLPVRAPARQISAQAAQPLR